MSDSFPLSYHTSFLFLEVTYACECWHCYRGQKMVPDEINKFSFKSYLQSVIVYTLFNIESAFKQVNLDRHAIISNKFSTVKRNHRLHNSTAYKKRL